MNSLAFDTHAFVKRLTQAGMNAEQAEALVEYQAELINGSLANKEDIEKLRLATERDMEKLRLTTEKSIEKLRLETKRDIEALKTEMHKMELRLTLRLSSVIIVTVGLFATLVKLLP